MEVKPLTRVEGEGSLKLVIKDGNIQDILINIFEPPRFFESILKGKRFDVIPDITARICGICPVAYQMSGVQAVESIFDVNVSKEIENLRRIFYYGEWIHSHAIHVFFMHLPDFLGLSSFFDFLKTNPDLSKKALIIKQTGQKILETIGGRSVHPVSVCLGGFTAYPSEDDLKKLIPDLENSYQYSLEILNFLSKLNFPNHTLPEDIVFVSLKEDSYYPILKGKIYLSTGIVIDKDEFLDYFEEYEKPYSTAKYSKTKDGKTYVVGPIARFNNCFDYFTQNTKMIATNYGLEPPEINMAKTIMVRMLEILDSIEMAVKLIKEYKKEKLKNEKYQIKAGDGTGISEAPRGILWHYYKIDDNGLIEKANIVPPTSQNQSAIEETLKKSLNCIKNEKELINYSETIVRDFDPCISCATHFLKLEKLNLNDR
jgi:coenzyme F420-reducing hydrogenase alpha subunit